MESSEREPSYYEVALTHRQLTVGLVVALTTVVVAFFAGVWIGRGGAPAPKEKGVEAAETATTAQPEQLTFFGDKGASGRPPVKSSPIAPKPGAAPPPTAAATPAETEAEALRTTLEAEMAANRVDGGDASATPASASVVPGARVTRESPTAKTPATSATTTSPATAKAPTPAPSTSTSKPATTAAAASSTSATAGGSLWIQVYSSTNRERATEIASRLKKSSFPVKTLEPTKSGGSYRVRVGPFSDRAKADRSASRLRREFKLDTWVTDTP